jgi:hypothetical protein
LAIPAGFEPFHKHRGIAIFFLRDSALDWKIISEFTEIEGGSGQIGPNWKGRWQPRACRQQGR